MQSLQDIESLIEAEVPEGEHLEYKRELPGGSNSWNSNRKLNTEAKKKILKEVVAFANAYGGTLLLGIEESKTQPHIAAGVSPLPDCADLADRWRKIFRDKVEPPLPQLQIYSVSTSGDEGIIVFHVGKSSMAPHRETQGYQCPIRQDDRCESMTMRQIQDMSINTARGLERLDKQLKARSRRFRDRAIHDFRIVEGLVSPDLLPEFIGVRLTAAPVVDVVSIYPVFQNNGIVETLVPQRRTVRWKRGDKEGEMSSYLWFIERGWKPMLRAARADTVRKPTRDRPDYENLYGEIYCDGLVELGYLSNRVGPPYPNEIALQEYRLLAWIPNLLAWVDQVRRQAQAPMAEYALEVEIMVVGRPCTLYAGLENPVNNVIPIFDLSYPPETDSIEPQTQIFPRYSFHHVNEIDGLISWFRRDLWNWLGQDISVEESFSLAGLEK